MKINPLAGAFIVSAVFLASCGDVEFDVEAQRARIESYLNSREYEYVVQEGVYKYTSRIGDGPGVAPGDSVYMYFSGYRFISSPGALFTTNIEADAVSAGLDMTVTDFTPKGIKIGGGGVIAGIDVGLRGTQQGDSLMLFITNDLAYGDKPMGTLPAGSTVMFKIIVDRVKR